MQATDPMVEAKLARADELPAIVVSAMKMAYASRQRMVDAFNRNLEMLLGLQDTASASRARIERMTIHAQYGSKLSDDDMTMLDEAKERAQYAERALDEAKERFITQYAAENRLEVRF